VDQGGAPTSEVYGPCDGLRGPCALVRFCADMWLGWWEVGRVVFGGTQC